MSIRALSACVCLLAGIAGFVAISHADERIEAVHFAKGKTSATLKDSIRGDASVAYELGASAGQTLSVVFKPSNASCYFNVLPPTGDTAIFVGSTSGNGFSAKLESSGTAPAAAPAAMTRGNMPTFCRGEASSQYGVKPASIKTDASTAGADGGSSIDGTADQGPDGIKKFRCRFDAAGRFIDVMAMTSDGE